MKQKYLYIILLQFLFQVSVKQIWWLSVKVGPDEWNNYLSWQIYNGSAWIDTIVSDGYPGQKLHIHYHSWRTDY
jgi:hypothetical protein